LVLGVGAWSLTRNNSESTDDTNSSQNGEVTTTGESSMAVFGPKAMNNTDYVATFKVTGSNGHSGTGVYEHSANGDYKISGSSQGQTYEVYFIGSAMISC